MCKVLYAKDSICSYSFCIGRLDWQIVLTWVKYILIDLSFPITLECVTAMLKVTFSKMMRD